MGLDIRIPIGLMFALFGALLTFYGVVTKSNEMYERHSLGINVNIRWGLVMLAFGVVMLLLGRRSTPTMKSAVESPEGRAIEEMEHRKGLEHERAEKTGGAPRVED
jgi:hypothetical protein